jgi:hypothetical protein
MGFARRSCAWLTASLIGLAACAAAAQGTGTLEQQRQAAFAAMLRDPSNVDLMLVYARLSVRTRDYEQVAATLERYLDARPGALDARLELAVAYYALGAYDIARYHLDIVRSAPDLPPEIAQEVVRYAVLAEERTSPSAVSGYVEAGPAYAGVAGEVGAELGFGMIWRVTPEGAQDRRWITDLRVRLLRFPDDDDLSLAAGLFRTGPEFSLDGTTFGWRMRPYFGLASSVDFDLDQRSTAGLGVQLGHVFSPSWSGFAEAEAGAVRRTGPDSHGTYGTAQIGVSWFPGRDTTVRLAVSGRRDDTDNDLTDIDGYGARLDLRHDFRSGWDGSDRKWQLAAYVLQDRQRYPSLSDPTTDKYFGYGVAGRAYLRGDYYMELRADRLTRATDFADVPTERELLGLMFGRDF